MINLFEKIKSEIISFVDGTLIFYQSINWELFESTVEDDFKKKYEKIFYISFRSWFNNTLVYNILEITVNNIK